MAENRKYYFLKLKEDFFEQDTIVLLESLGYRESLHKRKDGASVNRRFIGGAV